MARATLEVTTNPGLESFVVDEWQARAAAAGLVGVGGEASPGGAQGRAHVWAAASMASVLDVGRQLRSAHHLLRLLERFRLAENDPLVDIRARLGRLEIAELAAPETAFRVTSERSGVHDFTSEDVQRAAGAGVLDRVQRPVSMTAYDVNVRCDVRLDDVKVSVQHTRRSLSKRHVPRAFNPRTALKANVAWAMLELARPDDGPPPTGLLDPCVGSGMVLQEAAERWPSLPLMGSDTSARCIEGAAANLAEHGARTTLRQGDARTLDETWAGASVDTLVCNPPFGRRLGKRVNQYWFLRDLLGGAARLLPEGGRVVLLTPRRQELNAIAETDRTFRVRFVRVLGMGGTHPGLVLLERTAVAAPAPR